MTVFRLLFKMGLMSMFSSFTCYQFWAFLYVFSTGAFSCCGLVNNDLFGTKPWIQLLKGEIPPTVDRGMRPWRGIKKRRDVSTLPHFLKLLVALARQ